MESTFEPEAALAYLGDIERQLGVLNTASLRQLRMRVHEAGFHGALSDFAQLIARALSLHDTSEHII